VTDKGFDRLEPFLARIGDALSPRERKGLLTKIGQSLRRSNSARIAANVQPDGSAMEPRRPRPGGGKRGKMFRQLRQARILKVRATPDQVSVGFVGQAQQVAQVHHFGLVDEVGRTRDGRTIRARYVARQLLGFHASDEAAAFEAIEKHLSRDR
jgi:phage virion morphogenesis protein